MDFRRASCDEVCHILQSEEARLNSLPCATGWATDCFSGDLIIYIADPKHFPIVPSRLLFRSRRLFVDVHAVVIRFDNPDDASLCTVM